MTVKERVDIGNCMWGTIDDTEFDRWLSETSQNTHDYIRQEQEQKDKLFEESEMRRYIDLGVKNGHDF